MLAVPSVLVPVFFWITATFAAFEFCSSFFTVNWKKTWSPRSLPVIGTPSFAVSRTESVAQIIFGTVGAIWWQAVPSAPFLLLGPAASIIAPGPVWTTLHWPILLLLSAGVVQAGLNLIRPQWTQVRLAVQAAGLGILCLVLRAGNWVVLAPGVHDPARYIRVVEIVNQTLFYCFLIGLIFTGVRFVWDCIRQFRTVQSFTPNNRPPFFRHGDPQQSKNGR